MKPGWRRIALLLTLTLVLGTGVTACGETEEEPEFVAMVTSADAPEAGSYAAALEAGLSAWCQERGYEYRRYDPEKGDDKAIAAALEQAYQDGAKAIVAAGSGAEVAVYQQQNEHKRRAYLLLDGEPHDADYNYETNSNTHCVLFQEEQAGFLAGYAAVLEGYRRLGMLGGVQLTGVLQYQYGFLQGADYAASVLRLEEGAVTCRYAYSDSFAASDWAAQKAGSWYGGGVQLIFSVCGDAREDVLRAAENGGGSVILSDFPAESGSVLTVAEKRLSVAISRSLTALEKNGWSWPEGYGGKTVELGLSEGAVGISGQEESWPYASFTHEEYDALVQDILDGYVSVSGSISAPPGTKTVTVTAE